jgi:AhpD family alkylhydroperoxidase
MSHTIFTDNRDERICWLATPAEAELAEDLRKLFSKAREKLGFVPNVFVTYTVRPEHFRRWFNHLRELMQGESELSIAEREMISVVVSSENHCLYCLVSHGAELRQALAAMPPPSIPPARGEVGSATEAEILGDRITLDYRRAGLNERTTAMLDYAVKITRTPVECSEADVERLRQLGFSDQAIFDIAEVAAMFNFSNRLASATGMLPNREYHHLGRSSG